MKRICKFLSLLWFVIALNSLGILRAEYLLSVNDVSIVHQKKKVTGAVTDALGPVAGAAVVVKGTTNGTVTDMDGNYSLNVNNGDIIVFSFLGYLDQEIKYAGQNQLNVTLIEDSKALDEVVVTALGIKKDAKKLGYAVSTIQSSELVKTGTPNVATSLYGKAAGVRITAAPGGGSSAVNINVRGVNSISGTNQPLIVMDGIPIRNGDANNDGYWTDQRIRGNGLADINPEDIESLSILKGASASALYGSEAANGVLLITTKSGSRKKGVSVDFSATFGVDKAAYLPEFQTTFGPGIRREAQDEAWRAGGGWQTVTHNGQEYVRPQYETTTQFGPRYDGRDVLYWDGTTRKYEPYADGNGWEKLFRTGTNGTYNLAISTTGDKSNTRFSYTYFDQQNLQRDSKMGRHSFNLSGMMSPASRVKIDYNLNYMRRSDINRPYRFSRITNNFTGMFSSFDDVELMYDKTVTSLGYKNVYANEETPTPNESILYTLGGRDLINDYYWSIRKKREEEETNRLIGNITATIDLCQGLILRGKVGTDFTSSKIEKMEGTEKPLALGPTGSYTLENNRYELYYGEVVMQYAKDFNETWGVTATAGFNAREEKRYDATVGTEGGLSVENWFHINASTNSQKKAGMKKINFIKQAFFGMAGVGFKNYLFLEGTIRSEKSSTLLTGQNSYTYPSVNSSFVFTEALGDQKPAWLDYGKIRASYGIVGNAPEVYKANYAYNQGTINDYIWNQLPEELPNSKLRPEEKHEMEYGVEAKFLKNRIGFEATYYKNVTKDQILKTTTPWSAGADYMWENVGEIQNQGWEFSLYGTPIQNKDWQWDVRANLSFNKNRVNKLTEGSTEIQHESIDNGALRFVSRVGESMGDIYAYVPKEVNGQKVVGSNGLYLIDGSEYKKVGNTTPDAVGGVFTSLSWKDFFVDVSMDFSLGGDILNTPYQYMMSRGGIIQSMKWRDASNGGLSYYYTDPNDLTSQKVLANGSTGPNGQPVYDDGVILPGVKEDGTPNDIIVASPTYYANYFGWGTGATRSYNASVFDNSYAKMRELTIGYMLPAQLISKMGCKSLVVSLYGRNLFYFYKNLPAFDAESIDGTMFRSRFQIGGSTAAARTFGFSLRASF